MFRKKQYYIGKYPSCDMLNNALSFLFESEVKSDRNVMLAIEEIMYAILKADGYFYEDNFNDLVRLGKLKERDRKRLVA